MAEETLDTKIKRLIEDYVRSNIYTDIPARVISTERFGNHQQVDVQPLIAIEFGDGAAIQLPRLNSIPVVFPAGGGGVLTFPINTDDTVLLTFSMRSIDEWKVSDGKTVILPTANRFYSLTDAVAFPGLYASKSSKTPSTTDVELKFKDMSIKQTSGGDTIITNSNGTINLQSDGTVDINGLTIDPSGNLVTPGTSTAANHISGGISGNTHTHGGVIPGGGSTSVPNP